MERNRAYYRMERRKHINRKKRIAEELHMVPQGFYVKDGYLAKGKIHCSCPICSAKTRVVGWKASDRRKMLESIEDQLYDMDMMFWERVEMADCMNFFDMLPEDLEEALDEDITLDGLPLSDFSLLAMIERM